MKHNFWNRLGRIAEHGITKAADRLPDAWLKNQIKQRKADQAYAHAQETHEKDMVRRDQIIETAGLENIKRQKQIEKQDIKIEKDRISLEEMRIKHDRR